MRVIWQYLLFFAYFFILWPYQILGNVIPARNRDSRIIGGQETYSGEYPFAAAIHVQTSNSRLFCGGAIYTQNWILTAALCAYNAELFTIQVGSHTLEGEDPNRVTVATSEYLTHPDFNPDTIENDIGLIKLRLPIAYTAYVQPVYLPSQSIESGDTAVAIGWGQTSDFDDELSNTLMSVTTSALSNEECRIVYGNQITDNMLCVEGNYNEGTCIGDNGGPLLQLYMYRFHYIVAIASFISGNGCESTDPSGYTRVFPYGDWIRNATANN